jgi:hypothetical protein
MRKGSISALTVLDREFAGPFRFLADGFGFEAAGFPAALALPARGTKSCRSYPRNQISR